MSNALRRGPGRPRKDGLPPEPDGTIYNSEQFWARVDMQGEGECWNWTGRTQSYPGTKYVGTRCSQAIYASEKKVTTAGRVAFILTNGPIPSGMTLDHACFNPLCCNPGHLRLLTRSDNCKFRNPNITQGRPKSITPEQVAEVWRINSEHDKPTSVQISELMSEGLRVPPTRVLYILATYPNPEGDRV